MRRLILLILLLGLNGCSWSFSWFTSSEPTPELRRTLAEVTNQYLRAIGAGNTQMLEGMVVWLDYVANKNGTTTKEEVFRVVQQLHGRWTLDQHPLLGLAVQDVRVDGDNATVSVRKAAHSDAPLIVVQLAWGGAGWLVINDTLFGKDGLLTAAAAANPAS